MSIATHVANGAMTVGNETKHHRVPVVKGQAVPAWDPWPLKATGVTYSVSAQGADHTAGLVIDPEINGEAAVLASQEIQIINSICDSSGFCLFLGPTLAETATFYTHYFGESVTPEQLGDQGWKTLLDEREFNRLAGFTRDDDEMVKCLREEDIGPNNSMVFDMDSSLIAKAKTTRMKNTEKFFHTSPAG